MGNFYTDVIARDARFHSTEAIRDVMLLEPITREAVRNIIADAASQHAITLVVTETFRSVERQKLLFQKGATQLQSVGVHHYGLAADFYKIIDGKASWAGDWTFLRDLADKYGMVSGFDWGQPGIKHSFCDSDHVQRVTVDDQVQLFSGSWYPNDKINA